MLKVDQVSDYTGRDDSPCGGTSLRNTAHRFRLYEINFAKGLEKLNEDIYLRGAKFKPSHINPGKSSLGFRPN